jgi:hypothetical protein
MNPITFNEPFAECLDDASDALQVPLIDFTITTGSLYEFQAGRVFDPVKRKFLLPFESCRVSLNHDGAKYRCFLMQEESKDEAESNKLLVLLHTKGFDRRLLGVVFWMRKPTSNEARISDDLTIRSEARTLDGRTKKTTIIPRDSDVHRHFVPLVCHFIKAICSDFTNPHLYLCKKHPSVPQGKTVAWQRQREHFVFLHKSHAANKKQSLGMKCIEDGSTVDRAAHSRRAHSRLLSSPKFKHKQGQRVWVRSAWCGPKEWTDRSGQIYRIVENPEQAFNPKAVR